MGPHLSKHSVQVLPSPLLRKKEQPCAIKALLLYGAADRAAGAPVRWQLRG
jgi:hypothetical protein